MHIYNCNILVPHINQRLFVFLLNSVAVDRQFSVAELGQQVGLYAAQLTRTDVYVDLPPLTVILRAGDTQLTCTSVYGNLPPLTVMLSACMRCTAAAYIRLR